MPDYRMNRDVWLHQQAGVVRAALLDHMDPNHQYTVQELLDLLAHQGLNYSNPEYVPIGQILLNQGFLQAIA